MPHVYGLTPHYNLSFVILELEFDHVLPPYVIQMPLIRSGNISSKWLKIWKCKCELH